MIEMRLFRVPFLSLTALCVLAQQPSPQQAPPGQQDLPDRTFRATVNVVVAPTTVMDKRGRYVDGLQPAQFRLYDNGKLQDIKVDVSFVPISLVVAIQANADTEAVLPKIQKIGPLLRPLVVGDQGEVAILAFDHRVRRLTEFTNDPDKIEESLKLLRTGSQQSAMIDAVVDATRMLRNRPEPRRRVIVVMSNTQNKGSQMGLREALTLAQMNNVIIYPIDISRLFTTLTKKAQPPRPDPYPPGAHHAPAGGTLSPTEIQQNSGYGGNALNLAVEIFKATKYIFVSNPAEVFSQYTGGREYSFMGGQRGMEEAFEKLGEELHSQYLISYNPDNKMEAGFHEIKVDVQGRPEVKVHSRPGYWMAAVPD